MAKDPAFLFYPGDYLKDTQCLGEAAQVAYDRIMCEHMRNISDDMNNIAVSKERVDFFTKRLSEDQKADVYHVLNKVQGGFQIQWVAESICKRAQYGISRANNRLKKNQTDMNIISKDTENENENVIVVDKAVKSKKKKSKQFTPPTIEEVIAYFKENNFPEELAKKAYNGYSVADWHDSKGNKVINWKQKMVHVWFKPENKSEKKPKDPYSFV